MTTGERALWSMNRVLKKFGIWATATLVRLGLEMSPKIPWACLTIYPIKYSCCSMIVEVDDAKKGYEVDFGGFDFDPRTLLLLLLCYCAKF